MDTQPRRRRSDATRAAILRAARARFTADGYDRATIRTIAADADIDPSMVMRYYGNKANLFAVAVAVDLRIPDLTLVPRDELGTTLVTHFFTRWEGDPGDDILFMLLRSAVTHDDAAERMRTIFSTQLVPAVTTLVPDRDEAQRRAALISSQLLGLALCRHILRLPPIATLTPEQIAAMVGPTIQRYLTAPLPVP